MIKLFIADDQKMLNSALVAILDIEDDLEVLGSALDGQEAVDKIRQLKPDVAILDIEMPKLSGLEVSERLRQDIPDIKIIIVTTFANEHYFRQAIRYNVDGYLLKDNSSQSLVDNIKAIYGGQRIYDSELVRSVVDSVQNPLSDRENEILTLISKGRSTKDISRDLYLTEGTVRNYISSILSKSGTSSRIEAVNLAKKNKWI